MRLRPCPSTMLRGHAVSEIAVGELDPQVGRWSERIFPGLHSAAELTLVVFPTVRAQNKWLSHRPAVVTSSYFARLVQHGIGCGVHDGRDRTWPPNRWSEPQAFDPFESRL